MEHHEDVHERVPANYDVHGEVREPGFDYVQRYVPSIFRYGSASIKPDPVLGTGIYVYGWWNAEDGNSGSKARLVVDQEAPAVITTNTSGYLFGNGQEQGPSTLLYSVLDLSNGTHTLVMTNEGKILGIDGLRIVTDSSNATSTSSSSVSPTAVVSTGGSYDSSSSTRGTWTSQWAPSAHFGYYPSSNDMFPHDTV